MMRFEGKVALVTGGRNGIGLACAQRLSDQGARVLTAQRGAGEFETVSADFASPDAPAAVIADVIERAGRLDVLINNAGIMLEGTAEDMNAGQYRQYRLYRRSGIKSRPSRLLCIEGRAAWPDPRRRCRSWD